MTEVQEAHSRIERQVEDQQSEALTSTEAYLLRCFRRLGKRDQQILLRCLDALRSIPPKCE